MKYQNERQYCFIFVLKRNIRKENTGILYDIVDHEEALENSSVSRLLGNKAQQKLNPLVALSCQTSSRKRGRR